MERGWKEAEVTTPPSTDRPPPPQTDREGGVSLKNTENGVSFQRFCCVMLKVRRRRGGGGAQWCYEALNRQPLVSIKV